MVGPQNGSILPITRGAARVVRDRFTRLGQPIEKGGLAQIGTSYDGYEIVHGRVKFDKIQGKKKGAPKGPKDGVDILSRRSSTICAGELNFSVRNGKRWTSPQ